MHKGDRKPEGRRPKGFWSPEGKPTKPEAECFAPNSALGWGRKIVRLNSALEWGRNIIGSTKISYLCYNRNRNPRSVMGLVQNSTADSSTRRSGLLALGLSWHVCSLGLDQPTTDLGFLFLKTKRHLQ